MYYLVVRTYENGLKQIWRYKSIGLKYSIKNKIIGCVADKNIIVIAKRDLGVMGKLEKILIGGALGTALVFNPISHAHAESVKQKVSQSQYTSLEQNIADLENKVKQNQNDPRLHFDLSNLYEDNKQYDKSLNEFDIAVKKGLKKKEKAYHITRESLNLSRRL